MATVTDVEVANASFPTVRQDLNDILEAIATNFSADAEPSTMYANQFWYETDTNLLKFRNEDNDAWITLAYFDQTNDEWEIRSAVIQAVDSAGVVIKTDDGTTRITVADNGNVTIANQLTVSDGLVVDNDGATVATFDRATSDGTIVDLQKDGSSVGEIGTSGGRLRINSGSVNGSGVSFNANFISPTDKDGTNNDNVVDLGYPTLRFKDLYLSGGVYLGGTTSANYLDDYEEGTWTPSFEASGTNPSVTYITRSGVYSKIGSTVFVRFNVRVSAFSGGTGSLEVSGLPFAVTDTGGEERYAGADGVAAINFGSTPNTTQPRAGSARIRLLQNSGSSITVGDLSGDEQLFVGLVYSTDS